MTEEIKETSEEEKSDIAASGKISDGFDTRSDVDGKDTDISDGVRCKAEYRDDLPRRMYTFFAHYADVGAPSFSKFARSIGVTLSTIDVFRENAEFDRAYRECSEIRRDYLIDGALTKKHDASFTKYLLTYEYGMDESSTGDSLIEVTVEVID